MEKPANLNDRGSGKFLGPIAQLGWSVRLINLYSDIERSWVRIPFGPLFLIEKTYLLHESTNEQY